MDVPKLSPAERPIRPLTPAGQLRYKKAADPAGVPHLGLVAEQVEKADPNLVAMDDQGKPYKLSATKQ
jgi:hypothetical protein